MAAAEPAVAQVQRSAVWRWRIEPELLPLWSAEALAASGMLTVKGVYAWSVMLQHREAVWAQCKGYGTGRYMVAVRGRHRREEELRPSESEAGMGESEQYNLAVAERVHGTVPVPPRCKLTVPDKQQLKAASSAGQLWRE